MLSYRKTCTELFPGKSRKGSEEDEKKKERRDEANQHIEGQPRARNRALSP